MATVVTWHCRNQAAIAYKSAVKEPKQRTCGGKAASAPGTKGARTRARGDTDPSRRGAASDASGMRVERLQQGSSRRVRAGLRALRLGIVSSRMSEGSPGAGTRARAVSQGERRRYLQATAAQAHGGSRQGRGGCRPSSHRDRRRPGATGRVVTNDVAAGSPIQASKRARGPTARPETVTRCQESGEHGASGAPVPRRRRAPRGA